jgi:hypothetical protein
MCDPAESCDGVSVACPADAKSVATCRLAAGTCDVAESCDGVASVCPADAKRTSTCRAAGGVCDVAEVCDGISDACPVDAKRTIICRTGADVCDSAETCDGFTDACPADSKTPAGTACTSDGDTCTDDRCDGAGVCEHVDDGSVCDDFNPCTVDSCDGAGGCNHLGTPVPGNSCEEATRSSLQLLDPAGTESDKIKWKWGRGEGFDQDDLGRPDSDTRYALCIYDTAGFTFQLVASFVVEPSSEWWRNSDPKGWSYRDAEGTSSGVRKIKLGTGESGRSKILFAGAGAALPLPGATSAEQYFVQDPQVLLQLVSESGQCWQSQYSAFSTRTHTATSFRTNVR